MIILKQGFVFPIHIEKSVMIKEMLLPPAWRPRCMGTIVVAIVRIERFAIDDPLTNILSR